MGQGFTYTGDLLFDPWVDTIWPLTQRCAVRDCHGDPPDPALARSLRFNPDPQTPAQHAANLDAVDAYARFQESPQRSSLLIQGTNDHSGVPWNADEACTIVAWLYASNDVDPPPPCPE
jgi:hypothetical protein